MLRAKTAGLNKESLNMQWLQKHILREMKAQTSSAMSLPHLNFCIKALYFNTDKAQTWKNFLSECDILLPRPDRYSVSKWSLPQC